MNNKGQVSIILGLAAAIIGVIILGFSLPILNTFIEDVVPSVDTPTAIALGLIPVFLVIAVIVIIVRVVRGDALSFGGGI